MSISTKELIAHLSEFMTESRVQKFRDVLEWRTRHIAVVLEDIYQPQNASAVIRTADCFGIQDVHVIENRNKYKVNPQVVVGAADWVDIHKHNKEENNTDTCLSKLKAEGYKIIATTPHTNSFEISDLPIHEKFALVFGTEKLGISDEVKTQADGFVKINMHGFTESFNISVSAALSMYELTKRLHTEAVIPWQLSPTEKDELLLKWMRKSLVSSDLILKAYKLKKLAN
jgi:tRNA (guanosine-2'-O-)-methyltransferase